MEASGEAANEVDLDIINITFFTPWILNFLTFVINLAFFGF